MRSTSSQFRRVTIGQDPNVRDILRQEIPKPHRTTPMLPGHERLATEPSHCYYTVCAVTLDSVIISLSRNHVLYCRLIILSAAVQWCEAGKV